MEGAPPEPLRIAIIRHALEDQEVTSGLAGGIDALLHNPDVMVEPLAPLADLAGLKRAAFFNLRRAWSRHSLAGIVPNGARAARKVAAADDDPMRERARGLLRAEPRTRNVDIARRMLRDDDARDERNAYLANLQRAERIVQHERRALGQDVDFLRDAYGRGIVVDMTAISVILDEEPPSLAVVAVVLEMASGLLLGSSLGKADDGVNLEIEALSDALDFVHGHRADLVASGEKPDLALVLPSEIDPRRVEARVRSHVDQLALARAGGFSFGAQAVQIVGPRVGRMVLNPRRTLSFDVDAFAERQRAPTLTMDQARAVWVREVERHNRARIQALTSAGIIDGGGCADGHLTKVLLAIVAALKEAQPGTPDS